MFFSNHANTAPQIYKIISGGQNGADIAGVDAAIACNTPYSGTIPKGRRAEIQSIPTSYIYFIESDKSYYAIRTHKNVENSNGTVIFFDTKLTGGSKMTAEYAATIGKPYCCIDITSAPINVHCITLSRFCVANDIHILNVAGSRETKVPGIYDVVYEIISTVLRSSV